jgi:hypothetical protein
MTTIRTIGTTFLLAIGLSVMSANALAAGALQCRHSAAEYAQAVSHFKGQVAKARMQADKNPLYESDLAYYVSVLADAKQCLQALTPVATASR